ncbi:hypothetical protein EON64_08235, partial [archaeon]
MGKAVCHQDKVMLEQEWSFLSSASPYEASMHKTVSNSDEAMQAKADLFSPSEDCVFRLHLVALPSDDGEGERQRQKLLLRAKEQVDRSEAGRYRKSTQLLTSLASNMAPHLREDHVLQQTLQHKRSNALEQRHYLHMYAEMARTGFSDRPGRQRFIEHTYGKKSGVAAQHRDMLAIRTAADTPELSPPEHSPGAHGSLQSPSHTSHASNTTCHAQGEAVRDYETQYWTEALKLRVPTQSWSLLPQSLQAYDLR